MNQSLRARSRTALIAIALTTACTAATLTANAELTAEKAGLGSAA